MSDDDDPIAASLRRAARAVPQPPANLAARTLARVSHERRRRRLRVVVATVAFAAAAVLAVAVLIDLPMPGLVLLGGVALLAFAMVSSFPYAKLARIVKLPPWLWLLPIVGALVDPRLTFALMVFAYLASGPVLWLRTRQV